jgi:hypothetical protein
MAMSIYSRALRASAVAALLMTSACSGGTSYESYNDGSATHGKPETADLAGLKDFTKVDAAGPDTVVVTVGQPFKVAAEGSKDVLDVLEIKVVDGELRIGRKSNWEDFWKSHSDDGATIRVSMPAVAAARLTGSGDMTLNKAEGDSLELELTGSGNLKAGPVRAARLDVDVTGSGGIDVAGTAGNATFSATGSGDIEGEGLKAGSASVSVLGSGDVALASDGAVDIRIAGSGDVTVRGKAQCKVSTTGSGAARCAA